MPTADVIHFSCQACTAPLTVPVQLAGVTGPCPFCGQTITSPAASQPVGAPVAAPAPVAVPVQQPPVASPHVVPAQPDISPQVAAYPNPQYVSHPAQQQYPVTPPPASAPQHSGYPHPPAEHLSTPAQPWPPAPLREAAAPVAGAAPQVAPWQAGTHGIPVPATSDPARGQTVIPGIGQSAPVAPLPVEPLRHAGAAGSAALPLPGKANERVRERRARASSGDASNRLGALLLAMLMGLFVIGGLAYFFRDSLMEQWQLRTMEDEEPSPAQSIPSQNSAAKSSGTGVVAQPPEGSSGLPTSVPDPTPTITPAPKPGTISTDAAPAPAPVTEPAAPTVMPAVTEGGSGLEEIPGVDHPQTKVEARPKDIFAALPPEAAEPAQILKKFIEAKDWKERLQYVQWPTQMQPLMENYYQENTDGPIEISQLSVIVRKDVDSAAPPYMVFQADVGLPPATQPIMVEHTADGWKVDWLTFIEFKEDLLGKFCAQYVEEPATFHVMAQRKHYIGNNMAKFDDKLSYEIHAPLANYQVKHVFVPRHTPLAEELERTLNWSVKRAEAVLVELKWRRDKDLEWIELVSIPQYHWRTLGPDAKGLPEEPTPPAVEETPPPPAPKGRSRAR